MKNPVEAAIKTMSFGAGIVGVIVFIVFRLL